MPSPLYYWALIVSALICGALTHYAWNRRPRPGASGLAAFMLSAAIWSLGYALELAHIDLPRIYSWVRLEYIGIAASPVCFLIFALQYSGRGRWLQPRRVALLFVVPLLTVLMVATNPWHYLYYSSVALAQEGALTLLVLGHGPFYWLHVAYSWLALSAGLYMLVRAWRSAPAENRAQTRVVLLASLAPLIANIAHLSGWPLRRLDLTPFAFAFTGLLIALAILRYRLLALRPVMHDVLLRNLQGGVIAADANHRLIEVNPMARRLLGLDESAIGQECSTALAAWPEMLALCHDWDKTQCVITRPRGEETLYLEARATPLLDDRQRYIGSLLVLLDVSARHRLQAEQSLLGRILEESLNEVYVFDAESLRFITVNRGARENLGYTVEELRALTPVDIKPAFTAETFVALLEPLRQGRQEALRFETRHRRKDGSTYPVEVHVQLMRQESRALFVALIQDTTQRQSAERERLEMQQRLLQAQKLESLGVLAGGVAHDFNNLLTGIIGNLDLARLDLAADSPVTESLREAGRAAQRAAELTRQMLAYSGRGKFIVQPLDLSQVVSGMTNLLRSSISKRATLDLQLARDLPRIQADLGQVQQAVMSLATNASEALGEGAGAITLRTGVGDYDQQTLRASRLMDHPPAGRYVFLEISDTGCGISEEAQARLFEPFFSTKFVGRGLGLAAVLGIMRGYRGAILVRSEPGFGSVFTLLWPVEGARAPDAATSGAAAAFTAPMGAPAGVALVVDDEATVREAAERILRRQGVTVLSAASGEEGLTLLAAHPEIACVLLDLTMPGMDGQAALAAMRGLRPDLRVILSSGYPLEELASRFADDPLTDLFQKPYQASQLCAIVARALNPNPL